MDLTALFLDQLRPDLRHLFADTAARMDRARDRARAAIRSGGVYRVDRRRVDFTAPSLPSPQKVAGIPGAVDVWGVATRSGVFMYYDAKGQPFPEYRPADQVHNRDSLASLVGVPFTIDHPRKLVDSSTARDLVHGVVLEVRTDGPLVLTRIRLFTDDVKAVIDGGVVELSCGYTANLVDGEGVSPEGEPYKATQTDIVYNHLALVDRARAGHIAQLHLDATPSIQESRPMLKKLIFALAAGPIEVSDSKALHTFADCFAHSCKAKHDAIEATPEGVRSDLETAGLTLEMEGEKPVQLILPMSMIETIMGSLGVAAAGPEEPAPTEAVPGAEEAPEDQGQPPLPAGAEGGGQAPAALGTEEEEEEDKLRGKPAMAAPKFNKADREEIGGIVESVIKRNQARADAARALREVAGQIIGDTFDAADKDDTAVRVEVIRHVLGDSMEISRLVDEARRDNAEAVAGIRALFAHVEAKHTQERSDAAEKVKTSATALAKLFDPKTVEARKDGGEVEEDPRRAMIARQDARSRGEDPDAEATDAE